MPLWIRFLKKDGIGQQIRADGPQSHLVKAGTPTMGGVIILLAVVLTCFIMLSPPSTSCSPWARCSPPAHLGSSTM